MKTKKDNMVIDLIKIAKECLKRWWQLAFVGILTGGISLLLTMYCVTPTYESVAKIYVNNSDFSVGNISITSSDISASNSLVDLYIEILNTKKTLDIVIDQAGLDYNYEQVMKMITSTASNGTSVLKITVTSTSSDEAHLIASTIADVLPDMIAMTIRSSEAVVVDDAVYPVRQSSPSYPRNTVLGAIFGMMLVVIAIAIREIRSAEIMGIGDVHEITEIPVLGYITDFNSSEKGNKYARYYYKKTQRTAGE